VKKLRHSTSPVTLGELIEELRQYAEAGISADTQVFIDHGYRASGFESSEPIRRLELLPERGEEYLAPTRKPARILFS
jgi:hypothetical protein